MHMSKYRLQPDAHNISSQWIYYLSWDYWHNMDYLSIVICKLIAFQSNDEIDGILPKGPYPPCLRMADIWRNIRK